MLYKPTTNHRINLHNPHIAQLIEESIECKRVKLKDKINIGKILYKEQ
jgi:hypothetical protein